MKLPTKSALQAKEFLLLMNLLDQCRKNSKESIWKILLKTEDDTETCFSPHQASNNTFLVSSFRKKPLNKVMIMESISFNMLHLWALFQVLRLIRDLVSLTQRVKTGQKDWILFQPWPNNSTN